MLTAPDTFPAIATQFLLPGPAGALELATAPGVAPLRQGVGIICHPHSLFGGSMDNKVVTTVERALRELGLATVRFNFRGVGRSAGNFDEGAGERADLLAVVAWVRRVCPQAEVWLAGFSFGAFVSIGAAAEIAPAQLISVAPPVGRFAFDAIAWPDCPWLVVQPEADEVVEPAAVFAWADRLGARIDLVRIAQTSHFFHGQLPTLRAAIKAGVRAPLPAFRD